MTNQRTMNAVIFGGLFIVLAPFFGGLIWAIYIIMDAANQANAASKDFAFTSAHFTLMFTTIATAYKHVILPTLLAGFVGGWWRHTYRKVWACLLFGIFAAATIIVFKYIELVVINTPYMEANTWQYLQIIATAFGLPAFFVSSILSFFLRDRRV